MNHTQEGKWSPMSNRRNFDAIADSETGTIDSKTVKKPRSTSKKFFGPPTGVRDIQADSQQAFKKKVQPPMLIGRAKMPVDLGTFDLPKANQTQTMANTRRTNSFRNNNVDIKHMSNPPQMHTQRANPSSSLANKKWKNLSPGPDKPPQFVSAKMRSMVINQNCDSMENPLGFMPGAEAATLNQQSGEISKFKVAD